jgi:hypothetical protein
MTEVFAARETEIILSPPSSLNPVPALPAALRVDNHEQVLSLLQTDPVNKTSTVPFRQLLVFGTESLRTLIMRQVLSDPHTRTFKGKKKNWDAQESYPINGLTVTTQLVRDTVEEDVDVVTYFLRPDEVQTQLAAQRIRSWRKKQTHHRLVYMPQPTALVQKLLHNLGLTAAPNVSVHRLQIDVFPLETDVLSLEYPDALKEAIVEGTPSTLISTIARSLLKLQDVVGKIPRIQSYGPMGEEIVRKLLNLTVDEYLASNADEASSGEVAGDISALVVFDRRVDLVTPMLTPLTYEGLLDDVMEIDCGYLHVNVNTINPEDEEKKADEQDQVVALGLNGSDTLYAEVRDQHVEKFGSFLQNQAKALQASHATFTSGSRKKDLAEIHAFGTCIGICQ